MIFKCALKLSICAKEAQCYLPTKSVITFLGGAGSIIQVGFDSLILCSYFLFIYLFIFFYFFYNFFLNVATSWVDLYIIFHMYWFMY